MPSHSEWHLWSIPFLRCRRRGADFLKSYGLRQSLYRVSWCCCVALRRRRPSSTYSLQLPYWALVCTLLVREEEVGGAKPSSQHLPEHGEASQPSVVVASKEQVFYKYLIVGYSFCVMVVAIHLREVRWTPGWTSHEKTEEGLFASPVRTSSVVPSYKHRAFLPPFTTSNSSQRWKLYQSGHFWSPFCTSFSKLPSFYFKVTVCNAV